MLRKDVLDCVLSTPLDEPDLASTRCPFCGHANTVVDRAREIRARPLDTGPIAARHLQYRSCELAREGHRWRTLQELCLVEGKHGNVIDYRYRVLWVREGW